MEVNNDKPDFLIRGSPKVTISLREPWLVWAL